MKQTQRDAADDRRRHARAPLRPTSRRSPRSSADLSPDSRPTGVSSRGSRTSPPPYATRQLRYGRPQRSLARLGRTTRSVGAGFWAAMGPDTAGAGSGRGGQTLKGVASGYGRAAHDRCGWPAATAAGIAPAGAREVQGGQPSRRRPRVSPVAPPGNTACARWSARPATWDAPTAASDGTSVPPSGGSLTTHQNERPSTDGARISRTQSRRLTLVSTRLSSGERRTNRRRVDNSRWRPGCPVCVRSNGPSLRSVVGRLRHQLLGGDVLPCPFPGGAGVRRINRASSNHVLLPSTTQPRPYAIQPANAVRPSSQESSVTRAPTSRAPRSLGDRDGHAATGCRPSCGPGRRSSLSHHYRRGLCYGQGGSLTIDPRVRSVQLVQVADPPRTGPPNWSTPIGTQALDKRRAQPAGCATPRRGR
jgi:hypothetical protein